MDRWSVRQKRPSKCHGVLLSQARLVKAIKKRTCKTVERPCARWSRQDSVFTYSTGLHTSVSAVSFNTQKAAFPNSIVSIFSYSLSFSLCSCLFSFYSSLWMLIQPGLEKKKIDERLAVCEVHKIILEQCKDAFVV